ncbi:MAG: metal-dependent transcriptional regulator [Lachnospiraceae bacterium]|nr:metal-dependent transcriptional regulator [Lachnospiraceae bacterium]
MKRNESQEDYLESILILSEKQDHVRSIDVVNDLGFKKSSVSVAMKLLREKNLIEVSPEGYLTLTAEGLKIAESVYERHKILSKCLMALGVSEEVALEDACRIEHDLSEESFQALKKHLADNERAHK